MSSSDVVGVDKLNQNTDESKRGGYHHGNLREALVRCGIEILNLEGFDALSLRQVARDVGVSQTAPLHHFPSKVDFLAAVAAQGFRMMFEQRIVALKGVTDPRERLLSVMLAHLHFSTGHPALFRVMYGSYIPAKSHFPELEQAASRSYGILETAVGDYLSDRGKSLSRVRPASLAVWTACHGLATIMADRQNAWDIIGHDPIKIGRDVFGIFIAGLDQQA
ncbi:TetR/AcrR family transcriptional regulator [Variovorax sp. OV700]|jgi:AcrR family transcriptional regulator|uniref:TetR/AcrR family transcriptional regulator n=1 Tax=Variovorax sp. OV700 TaxID=1882826 RepID=UPI00088AA605|nr:TetR/AcrR family transcriptional regulator [Variovorax sp. OV700]SDH86178.1 transcriptional regulator, TetR family [Variovorax sp. OV700]